MKKNNIIKLLIVLISLGAIIAISIMIFKKFENNDNTLIDSKKFSSEYTKVPKDNVFVYSSADEIIKILTNGTGVVYLGFPECKWCQAYVEILNEAAKEEHINKIYYYNILEDRKNNTASYKKLLEILDDNLLYDDEGNRRIFVPDVTVVKRGEIIGHDNESSVVTESDGTPEEYWTKERREALKNKLKQYFSEINDNVCSSC